MSTPRLFVAPNVPELRKCPDQVRELFWCPMPYARECQALSPPISSFRVIAAWSPVESSPRWTELRRRDSLRVFTACGLLRL